MVNVKDHSTGKKKKKKMINGRNRFRFIYYFSFHLIISFKLTLDRRQSSSSSSNLSSSTASSVQIYTVMGLFNNKNYQKPSKVQKSDEKEDANVSKPIHRSSKHHSNQFNGTILRPMPQLSLMQNQFNPFPPTFGHTQFKYQFPSNIPYDLNKYIPSSTPINPYLSHQPQINNYNQIWPNGIPLFNDRSPFQQRPAVNIYQQHGWPSYPPPTNF